jgi:hypothetical protein
LARVPEITTRFAHEANALPPEVRAHVGRLVRTLAEAETYPHDETTTWFEREDGSQVLAYVRRVPGRNLWIWYRPTGRRRLELLHLSRMPP